jgi:hypothetical protein
VIIVESPSPLGEGRGGVAEAPTTKLSKAERAALKVASMAKDSDQPALIDVETPKRLTQKGKAPKAARPAPPKSKSTPPKPDSKSPSKKTSPPPAEEVAPAAAPESKSAKPKLRMRLVNGKLIPVDDGPSLF